MSVVTYAVLSAVVGLLLFRKSREWMWGRCSSQHSLKGKTFLITGATSGVGKETVRQLLQRHATVIIGNRDANKTESAIQDWRQSTSSGNIIFYRLDLASFASIKQFVDQINKNHTHLDVLINNAGVAVPLNEGLQTEENLDINIGVNHFGHFLLTFLLLEKLKNSAPSRIIIVSSTLHEKGAIDLEDLNSSKFKNVDKRARIGYCNSKLANVYHGRELAERLKDDNVDIRLVCPGWAYTGLFQHSHIKWWQYIFFAPIAFIFMRSAWQGSQTIVYCATEEKLPGKSGDFYRDCKLYQSKANFDALIQKSLWDKSMEVTKISQFIK